MGKFKLDLDEFHRFRMRLDAAVDEIAQHRRVLDVAVIEANSYWNDSKYAEHAARIAERLAVLQVFESKTKEYVEWMTIREQLGRDVFE